MPVITLPSFLQTLPSGKIPGPATPSSRSARHLCPGGGHAGCAHSHAGRSVTSSLRGAQCCLSTSRRRPVASTDLCVPKCSHPAWDSAGPMAGRLPTSCAPRCPRPPVPPLPPPQHTDCPLPLCPLSRDPSSSPAVTHWLPLCHACTPVPWPHPMSLLSLSACDTVARSFLLPSFPGTRS